MIHGLDGRRVLILGFGRQGRALARWLPKQGARVVVNDQSSEEKLGLKRPDYPDVDFVLGGHPEMLLDTTDLVCISGGVPLDLPLLQAAGQRGIPITNDAQLFIERCPAPIIGITGSAGKTTTTTLVGDMVRRAGYRTHVGGNIGDVLLDELNDIQPDDCVVMELSSFQLDVMTSSPQVGAVLNVTPNHLDRHKTMEAYVRAKSNMIRFQQSSDIAVLGMDDPAARSLEALVMGELVAFSAREMVPNGAFLTGSRLVLAGAASYDYVPHVLCDRSEIPLRGDHNVLNVLAACAIAGSLGLAIDRPGIEPEQMREAILNFTPVPHRLEIVREHEGVTYVNDSIATAPERLVAALRSFSEPLVLLLGGADKSLPWEDALHLALQKSRHIVLFGKSGEKQVSDKVSKLLRLMGANAQMVTRVETLDEAVQEAARVAQPGDVVLLSPGGTSYDAYVDFVQRGEHFRRLVSAL